MNTTNSPQLAGARRGLPAAFRKPLRYLPLAALALSLGALPARADVTVSVDTNKTWVGYMNVYDMDGTTYKFGQSWGVADLDAVFAGSTLTLSPNTSIDRTAPNDPYWWVGGAGGAPNKIMDASVYVQDDSLAGQLVTFTGSCLSSTLDGQYSCVAFIKDYAPDYSSSTKATWDLVFYGANPFTVVMQTTPGHHIQYGFETKGPDARLATVGSLGNVQIAVPPSTHVYVDPAKTWNGYMNVFNLPADGGGYQFGSAWGTADLAASFSPAGVLALAPDTTIGNPLSDPFWWKADGTGNKNMDANFYVEDASLAGSVVTFSGYVWGNTLVAPYTSQAFIKVLDSKADYATTAIITSNLTASSFSITLPTPPNTTGTGYIVQYGFETVGPNANPALTPPASLGQVLVSSNALPSGPAITSLPATTSVLAGGNVSITVAATGSGLTYQWQKNGVNLSNGPGVSGVTGTTLTLSSVTGAAEANYTVVVTDSAQRTTTGNSFVVVVDPSHLSMDPHAAFLYYINAYYNNGGAPGAWSTGWQATSGQVRASIVDGVIVMQPNNNLYQNDGTFWSLPDGTPGQFVEQNFYIGNDALAGQTLTFSGYCPSNSLDASYAATAWIEEFNSSWAITSSVISNLVAGQPFSITLPTAAGSHIQYGLRVYGLDNPATSPLTQGAVLVSVQPPTITASRAEGTTQLSFATVSGHNYTVQYKNNLSDATWQNGSTVSGTGSTVTVPDSTGVAQRFYRLSIQ